MCGIAGAWCASADAVIGPMTAALAHRGPDDSGISLAGGIALGHRRLSIIDTSSLGHQPMAAANNRLRLVFNGEIYNFRELRRELEALGHLFYSQSDSEVLLAAYAQWGPGAVPRLRGMFAFAIHDCERGELFLARDRFGIKPLYHTSAPGAFLFASELKGLLASGLVERVADHEAFWHYLTLGSVPQPHTALRDVKMLPPAHVMHVGADKVARIERYWELRTPSYRGKPMRPEEAALQLRSHLEEAAREHMVADVPVGAFLSGGVDSSTVVALMAQLSGTRIRTFSVGFEGAQGVTDERGWAALAARHFGTEHTEIVVSGEEVAAQFDHLVRASDQPSLDGTNTYLISRAAGREVKVALSGIGADELFAGYPHFKRLRRADRLNGVRRLLRHMPRRVLRDRDFLAAAPAGRYATLRSLANEGEKREFTARSGPSTSGLYAGLLGLRHDSVARTTFVETNRYLPDTLLRDCDAMSMASSLEVRPMFLDHRLAEFVFSLPASLKLGAVNKPLLVEAVRDLLPAALLGRPKVGFEMPLRAWMAGPLRERARDAFASREAAQWFSTAFLRAAAASLNHDELPSSRLWAYLMWIEWSLAFGVRP
jgi:asparagine synthase (glutamine-hydrolysing)